MFRDGSYDTLMPGTLSGEGGGGGRRERGGVRCAWEGGVGLRLLPFILSLANFLRVLDSRRKEFCPLKTILK